MAKSAINNDNGQHRTNSSSSSSSSSSSNCGQCDDYENSVNRETGVRKRYPDYCRTMTIKDANGVIRELVFPKALDLDRPKRSRTTFSKEQLYFLEEEFQRKQYMVGKERSLLAKRLCLTETQVKVWFQNRRTKSKRDKCRETLDMSKDLFPTDNLLNYLQPSSQPPCNCYSLFSYQQYTPFAPYRA